MKRLKVRDFREWEEVIKSGVSGNFFLKKVPSDVAERKKGARTRRTTRTNGATNDGRKVTAGYCPTL